MVVVAVIVEQVDQVSKLVPPKTLISATTNGAMMADLSLGDDRAGAAAGGLGFFSE